METKKCPKCNEVKSTSEFHKNASAKDGLQNYCKTCLSSASKDRSAGPLVKVKPEALAGVNKLPKPDSSNPLSAFTPRQLMQELHRRGYEGELTYTCRIKISNM